MKSITTGVFFLCAFFWSVHGQEPATALAREVISGDEKTTIAVYPPGHTREDKIEAVALQSRSRINLFMMSDKAGEEIMIPYAILVLDRDIAFAREKDGTGATYNALVAKRRVLAERLLRLDEESAAR